MAESHVIEPIGEEAGAVLIDVADRTIRDGLDRRRPLAPDVTDLAPDLRRPLGAFVTLTVRGELNGCVGSIQSDQPLVLSVARHAWSAAFTDPRLPPLEYADYEDLDIAVSVLSPLSPIAARSRAILLSALRPGVDGLLIGSGSRRAVFLPSVWDELPDPDIFVDHLFRKAGLDPAWWPGDLTAFRFTAQKIRRHDQTADDGAPPVSSTWPLVSRSRTSEPD